MRIALVGDSHSQALWPRVVPNLLAAGHTIVLQEANPGWSEAKYLSSGGLQAKFQSSKPDLVVYELGGNNMKMDAGSYGADASALVQMAKAAGAGVLWLGPPSSNANVAAETSARHEATANLQAGLMPRLGASWVDSRPYTLSNHRSDGVHFDSAGYSNWAKNILPSILNGGGVGPGTKIALVAAGGVSLLSLFLVWLWRRRQSRLSDG